jgi:hypothetical protein
MKRKLDAKERKKWKNVHRKLNEKKAKLLKHKEEMEKKQREEDQAICEVIKEILEPVLSNPDNFTGDWHYGKVWWRFETREYPTLDFLLTIKVIESLGFRVKQLAYGTANVYPGDPNSDMFNSDVYEESS